MTAALIRTAIKETLVAAVMLCFLRLFENNHVVLQRCCSNGNLEVK